MTKEDVIGWLEFLSEQEHVKADGIVPCDTEIALGMAIKALKQPEIVRCKDYILRIDGMAKEHLPQSKELYKHIAKLDFENGDYFYFKSGGDGDNGEVLMDYFDDYFTTQDGEQE